MRNESCGSRWAASTEYSTSLIVAIFSLAGVSAGYCFWVCFSFNHSVFSIVNCSDNMMIIGNLASIIICVCNKSMKIISNDSNKNIWISNNLLRLVSYLNRTTYFFETEMTYSVQNLTYAKSICRRIYIPLFYWKYNSPNAFSI